MDVMTLLYVLKQQQISKLLRLKVVPIELSAILLHEESTHMFESNDLNEKLGYM